MPSFPAGPERLVGTLEKCFEGSPLPLGLTFSPAITILLMNRFLLLYGNEQSVAVYGCISYIASIIYLLPPFFKLVSVWLAVPLAQAATFVISVIAARITAIREAWIS